MSYIRSTNKFMYFSTLISFYFRSTRIFKAKL